MKKFSYNKVEKPEPEEDYFAARRKRMNKSRLFYFIALWIVVLSVMLYVVDRIYWVRFDGELSRTLRYITFPDDILVIRNNFREGESFHAGDTLFWYCSVNSSNLGTVWGFMDEKLLEQTRAANNVAEKENALKTLDDRFFELERQLTTVRKQVPLGLATAQDVNSLMSEADDMRMEIRRAQVELKTAREYLAVAKNVDHADLSEALLDSAQWVALADFGINMKHTEILPWHAKYDASVFDVNIFPPSICYKGNFVLGIQIDDPEFADMHVIMWSQRYKAHQIQTGNIVEVKIGKHIHKARVTMGIPTVSEVPSYLEQNFERETVALEYRLDFLHPEKLEQWERVNGIPLKIRTRRNIFKYISQMFETRAANGEAHEY